ncbi:MAG: arginine--tRNA ligase [Bacteroidetes bacterium]|nr:arginine--tRNA ligase [Bacteroidota bacterium]
MIVQLLTEKTCQAVKFLYKKNMDPETILVQKTNREFDGDLTIVVFPFSKIAGKQPQIIGEEIGTCLKNSISQIKSFNVIKGFLNLVIEDWYWKEFFINYVHDENYGIQAISDTQPVVIEYSSPNTNKPLHLGHIRNNLLGNSLSRIVKANGRKVVKVNLVNDRGIHVCKSMLAWTKWGRGETPESTGMKSDHLIGKYYVLFEKKYREQIQGMMDEGMTEDEAMKKAPLILEAQQLLRKWEDRDTETFAVWKMMNDWAYEGFNETYRRLGVDFDKIYYESETYLLGKKMVGEGLKNGVMFKKEDGSVWIDLTSDGLDEKVLQRADGTSVYVTQDLGTAQLRYDEFQPQKLIYVVGNEQIYHFNVLKLILKKLGRPWANDILHLSYGMVELPQGKMKSREGTVVDADDLMDEMMRTAKETTEKLGKVEGLSQDEAFNLNRMVSLAALKYFILKVDPMKTMLFNPQESIDFNGNTGPFIQYTHARIKSLIRKAAAENAYSPVASDKMDMAFDLITKERSLIKILHDFPAVLKEAGDSLSPAILANYIYELAKEFNQFYQEYPILKADSIVVSAFRIELSGFIGNVIKTAMDLLGIEVPERM